MISPRGVIFGLEGVLVDTADVRFRAWSEIAARLGVPLTREDDERLAGLTREDRLDAILARTTTPVSPTERDLLASEATQVQRALLRELSPAEVDPRVTATLATLRERGIRLAAASGSAHSRMILERTGLRERLDAVSDGRNVAAVTGGVEVYVHAAEFLALRPADCAVVTASTSEANAAHHAGFAAVRLGRAGAGAAGAAAIDDVADLLKYVGA